MNTPTPWEVSDHVGAYDYAIGNDDYFVAYMQVLPVDGADKANAALIVRAVNSHDALVAALETFERICTRRWRSLPADMPEKQAIDAARAALALAKEPT